MIELTKEEVISIINYLATKPYAEVFQAVQLLTSKLPKEDIKEVEKEKK